MILARHTKPPRRKILEIASFCDFLMCRRHTIGIGSTRIIMSEVMLRAAFAARKLYSLMQNPGISPSSWFQKKDTGVHWKSAARPHPTDHITTHAMTKNHAIRQATGVVVAGNILRRNSKIDILIAVVVAT